jgi:hypothetical protein
MTAKPENGAVILAVSVLESPFTGLALTMLVPLIILL